MLQEKAKFFADSLGFAEFAASDGWLNSFRTRHNITHQTLSGEALETYCSNNDSINLPLCFQLRSNFEAEYVEKKRVTKMLQPTLDSFVTRLEKKNCRGVPVVQIMPPTPPP